MPPDQPRPVATDHDSEFTLTIEDAAQFYANAGHARTLRTIQRYCASGHLDCVKAATTLGDKYFVAPQSVARHIAQINDLVAIENRASGLDLSRQAAPTFSQQTSTETPRPIATTTQTVEQTPTTGKPPYGSNDTVRQPATPAEPVSRQDAAADTMTSRYVAQLEKEVERLTDEREFLRDQIKTKDAQIATQSTLFTDTQRLLGSLQRMMAPLLGQADPFRGGAAEQRAEDRPTS